MNEEHYKEVINDYIDGKAKIQGDHPDDVMMAIDTFFHAGKMLMDNPEIDIDYWLTRVENEPARQRPI